MRKLAVFSIIASVSILMINGCDFGISSDDFEFRFKPKFIETIVTGYLSDASGGPMPVGTATFKISGPSASKVVNYFNEPLSTVISKGALSFALEDGFTPSPSKPVEIVVMVKSPGVLPTAKRIVLTSAGKHFVDFRAIDLDKPGDGVFVVKNDRGEASGTGRVKTDIFLESSGDESSGAKTSMTVGAGVKLTDDRGSALSGKLSTTMVRLSPSKTEALGVFPGGYNVRVKSDEGAPSEKTQFLTGGLVSLEVKDASGKVAKEADIGSGDLKVDIELPGGYTNPEKGTPIAAGDRVPIWKLDRETFEWTSLGKVALRLGAGGNLVAKLDLGAIGALKTGTNRIIIPEDVNIDWRWEDTGNLVLNFPAGGPPASIAGLVEAPGAVASFLVPPNVGSYTVPDVACNIPGSKATLTVPGTSTMIEGAQGNLCTTLDVNLDATAVCPTKLMFEAYGVCQGNDDVEIREANLAFFYNDKDLPAGPPRAGAVEAGIVDMCVEPGHTYVTTVFVEGQEYTLDVSVGASTDSFSIGNLSGGVSARVLDETNIEGYKQVEFLLPQSACGDVAN